MNELIKEWINKAEGDYYSALREYRARKHPNYDAAGFHAQQSIEKYIKAILQLKNIRFDKVHDLLALMKLCLPIVPELEMHKELLSYLNPFAVAFRYPGESATREEALQAIKAMKALKPILIEILGFTD
ncbi:HEPN domain-containing protein [candidate division KSB1 bacterium]|nr:HEPN domain-containing protein [candidate division KSB1 bacterium]MBL7093682.1 HEPN domain-containing protein [candidate division KSB1 bacterium]